MFSNVWPFFVRCWHVLTTKSTVVTALKKKVHKHSGAQRMGKARVLHLLFSKTKQFFTVWATFFFATGAAQDSQFCSRTSEWDDTRCHRGSNTLHYRSWRTASLCSSRHLHVPNTHSRARQLDGKSSTKQRFNICCRDVSKTSFASPFPRGCFLPFVHGDGMQTG